MDSGLAAPKSAVADLGSVGCRSRVYPRSVRRPGMTTDGLARAHDHVRRPSAVLSRPSPREYRAVAAWKSIWLAATFIISSSRLTALPPGSVSVLLRRSSSNWGPPLALDPAMWPALVRSSATAAVADRARSKVGSARSR